MTTVHQQHTTRHVDKAENYGHAAVDRTADATRAAAIKAQAAADAAVAKAQNTVETAQDYGRAAAVKAQDLTRAAVDTAQDYSRAAVENVQDVTRQTIDTVQDYSRVAVEKAHDYGQGLLHNLYAFLQWYTSLWYYAAGALLGFARGSFYLVTKYVGTVVSDAWHFVTGKHVSTNINYLAKSTPTQSSYNPGFEETTTIGGAKQPITSATGYAPPSAGRQVVNNAKHAAQDAADNVYSTGLKTKQAVISNGNF